MTLDHEILERLKRALDFGGRNALAVPVNVEDVRAILAAFVTADV